MHTLALLIFAASYIGVAMGRLPRLALDRTGIALLGAIAMIASSALTLDDALRAVDMPTILLLYAMMIISAQLRLGGFYTWTALRTSALLQRPRWCLLGLMVVVAALSAVLMNDIVCLAFTPVLCYSLQRAGLNPIPFLIGLAVASNIGSASTIIGNPQNMLIGQLGQLQFGAFLAWCLPPAFLSLFLAYGLIVFQYRRKMRLTSPRAIPLREEWPHLNVQQTTKGLIAVSVMIALFFTHVPRELTALGVAGVLLCSRKLKSTKVLGLVDWNLITLFVGLFVIMRGFEVTGWPERWVARMNAWGVNLGHPNVLTPISVLLSNLVSNVPAAMLLAKFLSGAPPEAWYVLALGTTFAGNLILIGSIANLIVTEQAARYGVALTFREHAAIGIPVTVASIAVLIAWISIH